MFFSETKSLICPARVQRTVRANRGLIRGFWCSESKNVKKQVHKNSNLISKRLKLLCERASPAPCLSKLLYRFCLARLLFFFDTHGAARATLAPSSGGRSLGKQPLASLRGRSELSMVGSHSNQPKRGQIVVQLFLSPNCYASNLLRPPVHSGFQKAKTRQN